MNTFCNDNLFVNALSFHENKNDANPDAMLYFKIRRDTFIHVMYIFPCTILVLSFFFNDILLNS